MYITCFLFTSMSSHISHLKHHDRPNPSSHGLFHLYWVKPPWFSHKTSRSHNSAARAPFAQVDGTFYSALDVDGVCMVVRSNGCRAVLWCGLASMWQLAGRRTPCARFYARTHKDMGTNGASGPKDTITAGADPPFARLTPWDCFYRSTRGYDVRRYVTCVCV